MNILKALLKLFAGLLVGIWNAVVTIIHIVDSGDDEQPNYDVPRSPANYNFREGDIDPIRMRGGIYLGDRIDGDI